MNSSSSYLRTSSSYIWTSTSDIRTSSSESRISSSEISASSNESKSPLYSEPKVSSKDIEDPTAKAVGNFGKWQLRVSVMMSLLKLPTAWYQLNIIFMAPPQDFWCKKPTSFFKYSESEWRKICAPGYGAEKEAVIDYISDEDDNFDRISELESEEDADDEEFKRPVEAESENSDLEEVVPEKSQRRERDQLLVVLAVQIEVEGQASSVVKMGLNGIQHHVNDLWIDEILRHRTCQEQL
ncbi:unnamed protein product [Arctia plantaginis]|uniref:Uncharacterized protein n=1 Tax=Arctia plantaginis TaxID=874455 RepID=A0A8S0Z307_ARCPL|nr:unnamed protein product [Arctia plantaginis]